jgi:hypothetical protein
MPRSCCWSDMKAASTPYGWAAEAYHQSRQPLGTQEHQRQG